MDLAGLALRFEPRLKPAIVRWHQLTPWQRRGVTFDDLVAVAGLTPGEFVAVIARAAFECTEDLAQLIAVSALPEMVSASCRRALTPEGFKDRQMFLAAFLNGLNERLNRGGATSGSSSDPTPAWPLGAARPVQRPGLSGTQTAPPSQPEPVPSFLRPSGDGGQPSPTCRPEGGGPEPGMGLHNDMDHLAFLGTDPVGGKHRT